MGVRLVLGWGASTRRLVEFATETAGHLVVVTVDEDIANTLREEGVSVVNADPADPDVLQRIDHPDSILVAERNGTRNLAIAQSARGVFPSSRLVVYSGDHTASEVRGDLATIADHVVDYIGEVGEAILKVSSSAAAVRAYRVRQILDDLEGELCVFTHDNPDPDALASAVALVTLADARGVDAQAYYHGAISHQSNRAFVNLLDLDVAELGSDEPLPECAAVALVDHALPGVNDSLPGDLVPDLIFDHHTPSGPVVGRYVDLRESVGATSSVMVEYLRQFEVDIDEVLATALMNGIRTDTKHFARKVSRLDFDAASYLWERADHDALARIENPSVSRDTLGTIGDAIAEREVRGSVLSSCVGDIGEPDALAQAADLLLQMEGIDVLLVYGITDGAVHASARARPNRAGIDLADVMREAFDPIGTAGGHEEMAGAQIPLGMLAAPEDENEELVDIVREVIDERFFETVGARWRAGAGMTGTESYFEE